MHEFLLQVIEAQLLMMYNLGTYIYNNYFSM